MNAAFGVKIAKRHSAQCALAMSVFIAQSFGQSSSPIATERPAVTDSSVTVPLGFLQIESGISTTAGGLRTWDAPETLLRYGVTSSTELRLVAPNYSSNRLISGFGDVSIGLKQHLGTIPGKFDGFVILTLSLPSGAKTISSHGYDPSVQFPWSRSLTTNWSVAGMFSVYWLTLDGRQSATGESTFLVGRQLTKPMDAFIEYVGDFPQRGGPHHLLHLGTGYKLSPDQQFDLHIGFGLNTATDCFIGAGYSFRFRAR